MRPIRTVIIDDEPLARHRIARLLEDREGYEVVGQFGRARDALLGIRELDPDLVFLDIRMPEMDGFELLQALDRQAPPVVIFVTAYAEHALKAFEFSGLDYLLKPFDNERFERTLSRASAVIRSEDAMGLRGELLRLVKEHWMVDRETPDQTPPNAPTRRLDRIVIREGDRIFFQRVDDIDYIEAANYKVRIHVGGEVHEVRETLANLEERLDPQRFTRIHRGVIVNIDRIRELQPYFNGAYVVILEDGTELKLSRRRRDALEDLLGRSI
ncbi:MAG TPA: LytTR family DNA-binding domain-containing protein [Gemmatimonadota bacterium]|nr:LytTR family DNA-binding domain-containing protein [Gemmatimonadota bacterium]